MNHKSSAGRGWFKLLAVLRPPHPPWRPLCRPLLPWRRLKHQTPVSSCSSPPLAFPFNSSCASPTHALTLLAFPHRTYPILVISRHSRPSAVTSSGSVRSSFCNSSVRLRFHHCISFNVNPRAGLGSRHNTPLRLHTTFWSTTF